MSKIYQKNTEFVITQVGKEYILMPVANNISAMNAMYTFNEVSAFIWDKIDGKSTLEDIAKLLTEEYNIDLATAIKDTESFVESIAALIIEK